MKRVKLVSIVGARPQFIKLSMISKSLDLLQKSSTYKIERRVIHTGQHYDDNMSKLFFGELGIPSPDYNLKVGSASHGKQTGDMLERIEDVLLKEKPNVVLVYGDTNSTLAGAIAAVKLHIPVGHIEAGLRSFNWNMPEEVNRIVTDHCSQFLFCPTKTSVRNLVNEGLSKKVYFVGDVMYDSILFYDKRVRNEEQNLLNKLGLRRKKYFLATIHRAGNTENISSLKEIFRAFDHISSKKYPVLFPLHPRTKNKLKQGNLNFPLNVIPIDPVSYLQMLVLEKNAKMIFTDSGGVQREAYFYHTPCVILRRETEWVEIVSSGGGILAGADYQRIIDAAGMLRSKDFTLSPSFCGDGSVALNICRILLSELKCIN